MANSTILTGQFVRISQTPASIGERILARIIDYVILVLYLISTYYIIGTLELYRYNELTYFFALTFFYLPALCYSLLFEVFNNGQSIGKKLLNLRVIMTDGSTPTLSAYLLRWLLYLFDVNLTGGLGVIMIIVTKNNQRLGDLAAGTMVIKENNYKKIQVSLDEFAYLSEGYRPTYPQAADLSLEQVNIISKALAASAKERAVHIGQLARKVSKVLSISQRTMDDESFL
ncbi:RDD family protein, partial [Bacteroides sp. OttesenSCG-928-J23]|nr:RDD family protein [Bacteroides sp. OttesenSCG-928-J23]MDL2305611.1 RDD family protein [Bacteroides sp. OttesenSCG-928-D19]